jgi:hypothetical protein
MSESQDLSGFGDTEASEADVREQAETVTDAETDAPRTDSVEVDEFDAAEQGRPVDLDPDEYR